jgi:hypothetical protein
VLSHLETSFQSPDSAERVADIDPTRPVAPHQLYALIVQEHLARLCKIEGLGIGVVHGRVRRRDHVHGTALDEHHGGLCGAARRAQDVLGARAVEGEATRRK